jgi:hypothetical protein
MAKGALIAMSCGVLAFSGRVAFLLATVPANRTVNVRWIAGISAEQRGESEQRLGLGQGRLSEGTTWIYELLKPTAEDLEAITLEPIVEDTHGFDRETFELPPSRAVQGSLPLGIWTAIAAGLVLLIRWVGNRRR